MKSFPSSRQESGDGLKQQDTDLTLSDSPRRSTPTHQQHLASRPQLLRLLPGRLSELPQRDDHGTANSPRHEVSSEHDGIVEGRRASLDGKDDDKLKGRTAISVAEGTRLANLKEATNAKLMLQQQRKRSNYGSSSALGAKRVSPIREEGLLVVSPSLDAAFASPLEADVRPLSIASTGSTGSARTVRASLPPTPADVMPLRTPSYPFPVQPGTPRTWSSTTFHEPFTTLSPTVPPPVTATSDTPRRTSTVTTSGQSTPLADLGVFLPPGASLQPTEDPRFPTPNLYDVVLQLNTEPGLEQWWTTVTNLMHDHFKGERVTLVMPLDPTDIENIPWGQKATFNMSGREEFVPHHTVLEQTSHVPPHKKPFRTEQTSKPMSIGAAKDVQMQKLHPGRLRPHLDSRHSYAGHGREKESALENPTKLGPRPRGPQRTATHTPGMPESIGSSLFAYRRSPPSGNHRHTSNTDPDFSSVAGGVDAGPHAEVFSTLRALDHEAHPLIEPGGISRVLERGHVVTVTRDYASEISASSNTGGTSAADGEKATDFTRERLASLPSDRTMDGYRGILPPRSSSEIQRAYEEYEQFPTSPWAQSPAPSPAIQADEEINPFFPAESQPIEESFNPATTPKDYSQSGQVEAIGVDRASTVSHVPLVHPTLSQPMQSWRTYHSDNKPGVPQRSNTIDTERRTPIAVLSVLSPVVPYPHNLSQALKLLGPHLATSFATAQQFSASHYQAISIRHRRTASGHNHMTAPMTIEPTLLDDLMSAEPEEPPRGSVSTGSITSPSDYSGRSRHSPSGSAPCTPSWDPTSQGLGLSISQAGTPAHTGSDMVDNYFDTKRRSALRSDNTTGAPLYDVSARFSRQMSKTETPIAMKHSPPVTVEEGSFYNEQNAKAARGSNEESSPLQHQNKPSLFRSSEQSDPQQQLAAQRHPHTSFQLHQKATQPHTLLHSYGASSEISYETLPGNLKQDSMSPFVGHGRRPSYPEDMPPPSERLLRTIIDSVPVQIFTARPDSGQLSWVNSKFLIYRGQESREVLSDPWQAIHPDDRTDFKATWHRSLRTAQQLQQKVRLERFDGAFRWFYVRAAPLKDKRQKIVHWIGTMMDFHEQHIAESSAARQQETAASEAKYRTLANSSPQIVFAVNRSNGVTFCNTQWVHYSGQSEAQALGIGFMDHVHPDDLVKCRLPNFDDDSKRPTNVPTSLPPEPKRTLSNPMSSSSGSSETETGANTFGTSSPISGMPQRKLSELATIGILKVSRDADGRPSYSTEVRLRSKEGEFRWHLVRVLLAESVSKRHDEEETWYGTCTDINDHKTLERDLKETMDEKSRFLSNMSHEIRTPLNGITGMVNFLIDSSLTAEQMEHVNIIRASTEGLRGLINDILDLSKAEAGMIQLSTDWMYVRALIEEVNDLTFAMAIDKGLELNYLVDENVPKQIKADRFRLRQILLNIIGNAIKFTQTGEVFIRCTASADHDELEQNESFIKFEIIDTGQGFTEKEAEHLFKRFSQIDGSSTRQHGGTGLGLVISRQLTQLHGGDMSAKSAPGKGSTFTFFIKAALPSKHDQPPAMLSTPGILGPANVSRTPNQPVSSVTLEPMPTPMNKSNFTKTSSVHSPFDSKSKPSPVFTNEQMQSPSPYMSPDHTGRESPSASSTGSNPSLRSAARTSSLHSERSSASSAVTDPGSSTAQMKLSMPTGLNLTRSNTPASTSTDSTDSVQSNATVQADGATAGVTLTLPRVNLVPPMYSILVICSLKYSREATVQHIDKTLPKNVPHQITAREHLLDCQKMLGGESPMIFTHIMVVLQDVDEIIALIDQVMMSPAHSATSIVVITDLAQRKKIMDGAPGYNYDQLGSERRLRFVFKPLKPSRFALIFDPQKEREMSTDRNQDSAQQVAVNQKQVFEELTRRMAGKDKRVLLVEDNRINQMVILGFLAKASITVETALDGVQCTNKVFAQPHDYYSVILCDLHMPNKDGYQTCKEIRKWERSNRQAHLPIIALSANVLGDVYQKCVEAGFNSYITKPVDFKELSTVLTAFMDPRDPAKPHEFMKLKRGHTVLHHR